MLFSITMMFDRKTSEIRNRQN